jgi:hypothetical protein
MPPRVLMISFVRSNTRDVKTEEKGNVVTSWTGIVPPFPLPHPTHSAAGRTGGGGLEGRGYCLGRRHCLPPAHRGIAARRQHAPARCYAMLVVRERRVRVADESSAELGDVVTLRGEVRLNSCPRALACFLQIDACCGWSLHSSAFFAYYHYNIQPARSVCLRSLRSVNTRMLTDARSG